MCAQNIVQIGFDEWELVTGKNIQWVDYGPSANLPILYSVAVVSGPVIFKLSDQLGSTPGYALHLSSSGAVITQPNNDNISAISVDLDEATIQNGTIEIFSGQVAMFIFTRLSVIDPVDVKTGPGGPPPKPPKTALN